jgi:preprotein translocase subunit SecD
MGKAKDNGEVEMGWIVLGKPLGLSETDILRAFAKKGRDGTPVIRFELKKESAEKFAELTGNHIGSRLAILVDGLVYSAPVIRAAIQGGKVEITGDFTGQQAEMIAQTLLLGRVPVELRAVLEKSPD